MHCCFRKSHNAQIDVNDKLCIVSLKYTPLCTPSLVILYTTTGGLSTNFCRFLSANLGNCQPSIKSLHTLSERIHSLQPLYPAQLYSAYIAELLQTGFHDYISYPYLLRGAILQNKVY